ncbi:hypothetical protein [Falsiphaeobacter marinintestinus]|uniref:hypothetical protein n=1 Tax=Falsiphaeobacter marinintestinus TaxID=1492905 RepID=UPI0011B46623|nr:hypothetical protein [Phaeobacter marinintestinus]
MFPATHHSPITLNENEQIVMAIKGRVLPGLADAIWIIFLSLAFYFFPLLALHRFFRPVSYLLTIERLLVAEPKGEIDAISINQIAKTRSTKTSLMVYGNRRRLWLARLPDAWYFETVLWKVIDKVTVPET